LRVTDERGDYQRLGDAKKRHADLRFVGATNRAPETLKHDFLARFLLRLAVPGLRERREDVPLLVRHLLRRMAAKAPDVSKRFFAGDEPRTSPALMRALLDHRYTTHVRELEAALARATVSSEGDFLDLTDDVKELLGKPAPSPSAAAPPATATKEITEEQLRAALERAGGVRERAWQELGLANRHVLKRLIKKYGIEQ
jgi:DNA-binding NtrC family response regulator